MQIHLFFDFGHGDFGRRGRRDGDTARRHDRHPVNCGAGDGPEVVITADDEPVRIAASELLSLRWSPTPPAVPSTLAPIVELVDGTVIPIEAVRVQKETATLTLPGPLSTDSKRLDAPMKTVAALRLQPLDRAVAEQWEEIRNEEFPSDLLVIVKRGGQSLDYLEGNIGAVTPEHVEFKLDGEVTPVARAKVAGLIYYRTQRDEETEPTCVVHGGNGLRVSVAKATLKDGKLQMTTAAGAELDWPLEDVHFADFSAGKVVYLSDLEPASQRWTPLVGMPGDATLAASYGRPRRDSSPFGGPLTLLATSSDALAPVGLTTTFPKGLSLRSRAEIVYRLPRGFRQLLTIAGIEPSTSSEGTARLIIHADDQTVLDAEIVGQQAPLPIDVEIAGVKRLKIAVDYGQNLDTGDWVNLCDLRIVK